MHVRSPLSTAVLLTLLASLLALVPVDAARAQTGTPVFINEIHYDNTGTDTGEFLEIAGPTGTDLTGWSVVLYNGANGATYNTTTLAGTIPAGSDEYGVIVQDYPSNGIQNGSPDGVALVDAGGDVIQFLSYEGVMTATNGPASGQTSTDIGVSQDGTGAAGQSLQLGGTGTTYGDFTWQPEATATSGTVNTGQSFATGGGGEDAAPVVDAGGPYTVEPGGTTALDGTVTDADGDDVDVRWTVTPAGPTFEDDTAEGTELTAGPDEGSYTLTLTADDGSGAVSDTAILTVAVPTAPVEGDVYINEIHYDNAGTDTGEFIEVAGPAGVDLTGWSLVLYNGNNGAQYSTTALSGTIPDQDDGYGAVASSIGGIQNGAPDGMALVSPDGVEQFLSYEGGMTATNGPAQGMTSEDIGVEEGSDTPVGYSLQLEGSGTSYEDFVWAGPKASSPGDYNHFQSISGGGINPPPVPSCPTDVTAIEGIPTSTQLSAVDPDDRVVDASIPEGQPAGITLQDVVASAGPDEPATATLAVDDSVPLGSHPTTIRFTSDGQARSASCTVTIRVVEYAGTQVISTVQGAGATSPIAGEGVTVTAVVTENFTGDAQGNQLGGFFIEEELTDRDGDEQTSEGIFVYTGGTSSAFTDLVVGDVVTVTGLVTEFGGQTQIDATQGGEVTDTGADAMLPAAAPVSMPFPTEDFLERVEGMRVTSTEPLYVAEYFNLDRYGEMVLTDAATGLVTPTQITEPGSPEYEQLRDENERRQITLDDARTVQNPDPIPFVAPPEDDGTYTDNRRRGDRLDDLTGVLSEAFGAYRIQVQTSELTSEDFVPTIERPDAPPNVGGDLTVASFNVLNYFQTIGDTCGPSGNMECRGANTQEELERQTAKTVTALAELDADIIGLVEIENDGDDAAVQALVDGLDERHGADVYDYVRTGFIGTDAITQAFIYRVDAVTPVGEEAVLDDASFVDPRSTGTPKNRPALAQTFTDASGIPFTVVVNHLKSKGSACGAGDDATDGSGNCNGTRTDAAERLVEWLGTNPTGIDTDKVLVIGDLNAYAMEDPIGVFEDAGYVNVVLEDHPDAYGYVFDGQQGTLDYALASPALVEFVTGAAEYGINADEADLIDYNTDFGRHPGYFNDDIPFRASDHDPVLVGLRFVEPAPDNRAPAADAGGPYRVRVGRSIQLDARGTSDPDVGDVLAYGWDFDDDGAFDDASGVSPTFAAPGRPPGTYVVAVRVTDAEGLTDVDETTVTVHTPSHSGSPDPGPGQPGQSNPPGQSSPPGEV